VKRWLPADSDVTLIQYPRLGCNRGPPGRRFKIFVSARYRSRPSVGSCPPPVPGQRATPLFRFERTNSIYFDYLSREIDEVHVTLPPDLEVESLPPGENVRLDYALYTTNQKQESGNAVMAVRDLTLAVWHFPRTCIKS